jgi:hypothetical protein
MADPKMNEAAMNWARGSAPICPIMSAQMQAIAPAAGGMIVPGAGAAMTAHIPATPCVGVLCAMAIKNPNGGFAGCGFAPGQDVANLARMLDARIEGVSAAMTPAPSKADGAFVRALDQTLESVKATLEETRRDGEATRKLVSALLERMTKK